MPVTDTFTLPSLTPGACHTLLKHRFGHSNAHRSAFLLAGTHADEHPGLLVLQHLVSRLVALEKQGRVTGRVDVVPYANPVGFGQQVFGQLAGRYNLATGENFNRNFPDITAQVGEALQQQPIGRNDTRALKRLFAQALEEPAAAGTVEAGKHWLLSQALEHDIVLDLHCDTSSMLHIYANLNQRERALALAAATGVKAVFLEEEAGGFPLDEAYAKAWKEALQRGLVDTAHLGFSATLELRGQADVEDDIAAQDAEGMLRFLAHEGIVQLNNDDLTATDDIQLYPLEGVAHLKSPATGIVAWKKRPGDPVRIGETLAEIVALDGLPGTPRQPVLSTVCGVLVARHHVKLVRTGQKIGMLAGHAPLPDRQPGKLMGF